MSYARRPRRNMMVRSGIHGLGQAAMAPETRWKYAALGLAGLVVAQFWWWNKKAPQVLRLGGY